MMTLSKKALDMLEYNGYSYKNDDNRHIFRHSIVDSIGLTIIILLTAFIGVFLLAFVPLFGLGVLLVSFLIFFPIVKRSKGKSSLIIDTETNMLEVEDVHWAIPSFAEIKGIYTHSKFVDEYASAFKSTSKEYRVTIGLEMDQVQIPVFKLIADHVQPSKEMNEVHAFLETIIRKGKSKQDS